MRLWRWCLVRLVMVWIRVADLLWAAVAVSTVARIDRHHVYCCDG